MGLGVYNMVYRVEGSPRLAFTGQKTNSMMGLEGFEGL